MPRDEVRCPDFGKRKRRNNRFPIGGYQCLALQPKERFKVNTLTAGNFEMIRIFGIGTGHVILVSGKKPARCGGPKPKVTGPNLISVLCECAPACELGGAQDSYFVVQPLVLGHTRRGVRVLHRDGEERVLVERLPGQPAQADSALGVSQDFILDQAFKDALARLKPPAGPEPSLIEIISAGALYGGFSGFNRMFVRVERRSVRALGEP